MAWGKPAGPSPLAQAALALAAAVNEWDQHRSTGNEERMIGALDRFAHLRDVPGVEW